MRRLDDWIKAYMHYTSDLEALDQFHFWAAVHAIGTALGGKTWFNMGKFKWRPSFYIVFVAPPGVATKSTTVGAVEDLLGTLDGVKYGPASVTWQALFDCFVDSETVSVVRNAHTSVTNVPHSSLCIQVSELGNFLDMQDNGLINFLVDIWDSRERPQKRKTRGGGELEFRTPCLNLIGATTPSWMKGNMPEYTITGGLTSRIIFVRGESKRQFVAYPFTQSVSDPNLKEKLALDLKSISELSGQFILTPEALKYGEEWYNTYNASPPKHLQDERMQGYASRKQCHVHKLAMVFSAAKGDSMVIEKEDLEAALLVTTELETSLAEVFNAVSDNDGTKQLAIVVNVVKQHGRITKAALFRQCCVRMDYRAFENALTGAVNANFIKQIVGGKGLELQYMGK